MNKLRIVISKSNRYLSAQVVDDSLGKTLLSANPDKKEQYASKIDQATKIGKILAGEIVAKKYDHLYIDRNNNKYHGRLKAFVEALRESGVKL